MDLDKAERVEMRSEEVGYGGLETEDGLVGRCLVVRVASVNIESFHPRFAKLETHPQVHDSVVQPGVQTDPSELGVLLSSHQIRQQTSKYPNVNHHYVSLGFPSLNLPSHNQPRA